VSGDGQASTWLRWSGRHRCTHRGQAHRRSCSYIGTTQLVAKSMSRQQPGEVPGVDGAEAATRRWRVRPSPLRPTSGKSQKKKAPKKERETTGSSGETKRKRRSGPIDQARLAEQRLVRFVAEKPNHMSRRGGAAKRHNEQVKGSPWAQQEHHGLQHRRTARQGPP
jgi:hypothetical protein